MAVLKKRRVFTPVRQLTLAVTLSIILYLFLHGHPSIEGALLNLQPMIRDTDVQHIDLAVPTRGAEEDEKSCLPYIFYDKPVKTGSTAVTVALQKYLSEISEPATECLDMYDCTRVALEICAGTQPRGHLIQHLFTNQSISSRLRDLGYYHVTSIREPRARVISAWRFSKTKMTDHYGISHNASFEEFLERFPRCSLYTYYDQRPARCTREEALERAEEIASWFDEVIDLTDSVVGDVHGRIEMFLENVNVAPSGRALTGEMTVPDETVELEFLLYNRLREKRVSLTEAPKRVLCGR